MKYFLSIIFITQLAVAAPLTTQSISNAVTAFISSRLTKVPLAQDHISAAADRNFTISDISPLNHDSKKIGYIASLAPSGFVLMRADDLLPALKLYSDSGSFSNLPPDFIKVIEWELSTELSILASEIRNDSIYKYF